MISRIDNRAEQCEIKEMIKTWLGGVELTTDVEEDPLYRPLIVGAAALMRHKAFDWSGSADDDTEKRWIAKTHQAPGIYYGIRFSASQPLMITFGWITKFYQCNQLKSTVRYARFQYSNGKFIPEYLPCKQYTFKNVLQKLVDISNKEKFRFCYFDILPICVNKFTSQAIGALDNYISFYCEETNKGVLDNDDSEDDVFFLIK